MFGKRRILTHSSTIFLFRSQGTDKIEGTNPNITKTWYPPSSSCIVKSNSKTFGDDATRIVDNGNRRQSTNNNSRSSNNSDNSRNSNNRNRDNPYGVLNENSDDTYLQIDNNDVSDDDSHNYIEGAARTKVSRSSSAATESMGLNASDCIRINLLAIIQSCVMFIFIRFISNS